MAVDFDELVARAAGTVMPRRFEAHVTVAAGSDAAAFAAACRELGVDCVAIELAAGAHAVQPMTASRHDGDWPAVVAAIARVHAGLVARGFEVVRVKVEAPAELADAPVLGGYYEFHVKLAAGSAGAEAIAVAHGAHVSRNARRDGTRFVTLRVYRAARADAERRLDALVAALAGGGHAIAGCIRELAIYDSRADLDAGWLEEPEQGPALPDRAAPPKGAAEDR